MQSASSLQPPQAFVDGSQTGALAGQSLSARHPTQLLVASSQSGSFPPQAKEFPAVHSTQPPVIGSQAGEPA